MTRDGQTKYYSTPPFTPQKASQFFHEKPWEGKLELHHKFDVRSGYVTSHRFPYMRVNYSYYRKQLLSVKLDVIKEAI